MRTESLANDVEVFVGDTYSSNATVFRSPEGTLIIDALASTADARALAARAAPVRLVILTHGFSDHLAALRTLAGVPVLAHRALGATFAREQFRSDEEATFFREPTVRIAHPTSVSWGRHLLELTPLPGHTESDLVIDVPSIDTLFTGDIAVGNIAYFKYSDVPAHRAALEWCIAHARGRVVQGHGGVKPAQTLRDALAYLDGFVRGDPPEPAAPFERIFHQRNLDLLRRPAVAQRERAG